MQNKAHHGLVKGKGFRSVPEAHPHPKIHRVPSRASMLMTFLASTGLEMADKCVKLYHCGTHATGWLKNGHPALSDGPVLREVCFHWLNDCCYFKQQILVRRCKNFYVYEFPGTGKSFLRYCGNGTAVHNHWKKQ